MSSHDVGLNFILKRPKNRDERNRYIYLRITIEGTSVEYSTQMMVHPEKWDSKTKRIKGKNDDEVSLNKYLETLIFRCRDIRTEFLSQRKQLTSLNIKNILQGKDDEHITLLKLFAEHNNRLKRQALAGEYSQATFYKYSIVFRHVQNFLTSQCGCSDILLKSLDYSFVEDYALWLREVRKCSNNTVSKYISNLKKIVFYAIKRKLLKSDPFIGYKIRHREPLIIPLSKIELSSISEKQFSTDRLRYVKDTFLFCCYTGLSYADVSLLRHDDVHIQFNDEKWLHLRRKKTNGLLRLPLLKEAELILKKYKNNRKCITEGRLLPIFSNQKTNGYLKEIAAICGISRNITFHMARHTFATTITLANGVPMETVSKMLGHRSITQTQHYAKILDKTVSDDMKTLNRHLSEDRKSH